MNNNKVVKPFDLHIAIASINQCIHALHQFWGKQDNFYNEYFYLEHELSRILHKTGELDKYQLQATFQQISAQIEEYDDECLDRFEIKKTLRDVISRFREEIYNQRGG